MDYSLEIEKRVAWIAETVRKSGAKGVVIGNSGGKDCALVAILCKKALGENVLTVIMPCESQRNYSIDREHALLIADAYGINTVEVDITAAKQALSAAVIPIAGNDVPMAYANMNPRLRMTALYSIAQSKGYLVAGTGNASEIYMGYFTKWGDGAYDFNPIDDLVTSEIYGMLEFLGCPRAIIDKAPSAGLYEGQTDESEMGVTYADVDARVKGKNTPGDEIIDRAHARTEHKRTNPRRYSIDKNQTLY